MKHNQSLALPRGTDQAQPQGLQSAELNRLLAIAVVNRRFRTLLLADPTTALHAGYTGEAFHLSAEETNLLQSIRASTLQDFVTQLIEAEYMSAGRALPSFTEIQTDELIFG